MVVLSVEAYHRLQADQASSWEEMLERVRAIRGRIHARRGGEPFPPPEEIIREMREKRGVQLSHLP